MDILKLYYPDYRHHQLGHDLLSICMSYVQSTECRIEHNSIHTITLQKDDVGNEIVIKYFHNSTCVKSKYYMIKGKMHGLYEEWYSNGCIHIRANYTNGVITSDYICYYENGDIADSIHIDNDTVKYYRWYMDKLPKVKYEVSNGYGTCVAYNRSGTVYMQYKFKAIHHDITASEPFRLDFQDAHSGDINTSMSSVLVINNVRFPYNEQRYGLCDGYDSSGKLIFWCVYGEGMLEGKSIVQDYHHDYIIKYNYLHGNPHGECTIYSSYTNRLVECLNYKHGKRHGERLTYKFNTERLIERCNYKNNELHGFISKEVDYNITIEYTYRYGKKEDKYICKNEDGTIYSLYYYKEGKLHGRYFTDKDGIITDANYYNGERHGKSIEYNVDDDVIVNEHMYLNGYVVLDDGSVCENKTNHESESESDHESKTEHKTNYVEEDIKNGVVKLYYDDGTVKSSYTYVDNVRCGPFTEYTNSGVSFKTGKYLNGLLHGEFRIFCTGQDLICYYKNGILDGPYHEKYGNTLTEGIRYGEYFIGSWVRKIDGKVVSEYNVNTRQFSCEHYKHTIEPNALFKIDRLIKP